MSYRPRPKEALQELRAQYSFVKLVYDDELQDQWGVVCKNDNGEIKVTGDNHTQVLRDAVKEKRKSQ